MAQRSTRLLKAALSALHFSGVDRLLAPLTRGEGAIFMLHHVRPEPPRAFEPNRILKVTPDFLEQVIQQVLEHGFEVLSLDEVHQRLVTGPAGRAGSRPFVCFTFDDGYRDNLEHAYPVFQRYGLPLAIYVPTAYPDGDGELWWLALETIIRKAQTVTVQMDGALRMFDCSSVSDKEAAFHAIYWWLRSIPEDRAREVVAELAAGVRFDITTLTRDLVMSWDEIRRLAADPLVTIGAHTVRHLALAKLSEQEARAEIVESVRRIEAETGRRCRHFSFPYGDASSAGPRDYRLAAELGLKTAVTTRKGLVARGEGVSLTGLPRVSLNGDYQHSRYVKVLLSGAPFAFLRAISRREPSPITV